MTLGSSLTPSSSGSRLRRGRPSQMRPKNILGRDVVMGRRWWLRKESRCTGRRRVACGRQGRIEVLEGRRQVVGLCKQGTHGKVRLCEGQSGPWPVQERVKSHPGSQIRRLESHGCHLSCPLLFLTLDLK
ncbi:hypothetical protein CEXT_477331 [Caerostris extrusa]|uniref:Uncharacterized protein n=1 Tax=Caerostris extrusa TaxID=172846 RepID=A0AAV4MGR9_CAEEX|nr:hypothetical protein CEXT_477331 [Caerostris extrusa]